MSTHGTTKRACHPSINHPLPPPLPKKRKEKEVSLDWPCHEILQSLQTQGIKGPSGGWPNINYQQIECSFFLPWPLGVWEQYPPGSSQFPGTQTDEVLRAKRRFPQKVAKQCFPEAASFPAKRREGPCLPTRPFSPAQKQGPQVILS